MNGLEASLKRIAEALNAQGIAWALGASMLLHIKGIEKAPRDIDLVVDLQDAGRADAALSRLGAKQPPGPSGGYGTRVFCEYEVDGTPVDMMAGLVIHHAEGDYAYRFPAESRSYMALGGMTIPLCPLEDWLVLYQLMPGRTHRVRAIEAYFERHAPDARILRAHAADPRLPAFARERLLRLMPQEKR